MHAKFHLIKDAKVDQSIDINFTPIFKQLVVGEITGIGINDKLKFIQNYIETINQGCIPLLMNPKIPRDVLIDLAKANGVNKILLDSEEIALGNGNTLQDLGHILCSSGTTSLSERPKSYYFKFPKPLENAKAHYESFAEHDFKNILFPLPVTHSFGVVVGIWGSLILNSTTYLYDDAITIQNLLEDIRKYDIDLLYLTPTLARQIIKFSARQKEEIRSPSVISIGSSTLYQSEMNILFDIFPKSQFYYTYGLTEMGPRVSTYKVQRDDLNDNHASLPLGQPIAGVKWELSKTLKVQSEYSSENFNNQHFDTNDCIFEKNGRVFIEGRQDDVIIYQGINIYPSEIEALLFTLEGIDECVFLGIKSKTYGEVPVLVINGKIKSDLIMDYLKKHLPQTHLPKKIIRDTEIPKTALGKVKRVELSKTLSDLI